MADVQMHPPRAAWQHIAAHTDWVGSPGWELTSELRTAQANPGTPYQIISASGPGTGHAYDPEPDPPRQLDHLDTTCWCGKQTLRIPTTWVHNGWTLACHRPQCQRRTDLTPLPYRQRHAA